MFIKSMFAITTFVLAACSSVFAETSVDPVSGIRQVEGCVYDMTTHKKVKGAKIQIWTPGGSVVSSTTGNDGCFDGGGVGFTADSGGFIEASATIRGKHYRKQFLLPPNVSLEVGVDYHYDFFLDTLPKK